SVLMKVMMNDRKYTPKWYHLSPHFSARREEQAMSVGNIDFVNTSRAGLIPLHEVAVRLHPDDDVAIAKTNLQVGSILDLGNGNHVRVRKFILSGHKVALRDISAGSQVRRYGQVIGFATEAIPAGEHVHTHNLSAHGFEREYVFGTDV